MKIISYLSKPKFSPLFFILFVTAVLAIELITLKYYKQYQKHCLMAATFVSPLPEVIVAKRANKSISRAYKKQYDFGIDWFTPSIPVWEKALECYKGKANIHYLEVGVFEGRSLIWMLENILTDPTAKATAIDIFHESFKDKYFANIDLSGFSNKVNTIINYSQLALRELPYESFDIIYIDGSHTKHDVLEDAVLSWRLLKVGGLLIFDDYRWAKYYPGEEGSDYPKFAIDLFAQCMEKRLEVIHNGFQLILRRIK